MKATAGIQITIAALLLALASASQAAPADSGSLAERQVQQVAQAKQADDKRKAEDERKRDEMERLAKQAGEDRKQDEARIALDKKKKEQLRQQAQTEQRCVIKSVMTDAEIAKCR